MSAKADVPWMSGVLACGGDGYRGIPNSDHPERSRCEVCENWSGDSLAPSVKSKPKRLEGFGICPGPRIPEWLAIVRSDD